MARSQRNRLIERLIEGDRPALGEFFDRYAGVVNALALRLLGDTDRAEDLVRTVFVRAWREAEHYDDRGGTPMAWLLAMTRETAFGRLYGLTDATGSGARRPVRALGYYEGLTQAEVAEQFGQPGAATQDRQHAGLNETHAQRSPPEQARPEIVRE